MLIAYVHHNFWSVTVAPVKVLTVHLIFSQLVTKVPKNQKFELTGDLADQDLNLGLLQYKEGTSHHLTNGGKF